MHREVVSEAEQEDMTLLEAVGSLFAGLKWRVICAVEVM